MEHGRSYQFTLLKIQSWQRAYDHVCHQLVTVNNNTQRHIRMWLCIRTRAESFVCSDLCVVHWLTLIMVYICANVYAPSCKVYQQRQATHSNHGLHMYTCLCSFTYTHVKHTRKNKSKHMLYAFGTPRTYITHKYSAHVNTYVHIQTFTYALSVMRRLACFSIQARAHV